MSVTKELLKLQELDIELASDEKTHALIIARLSENKEITDTRKKLETEKKLLEEKAHQQRMIEHEVEDISIKLAKSEQELYSGKTSSPKELSSLQQEINNHKSKRSNLEDQVLGIMETVEQSNITISGLEASLKHLEADWQGQQTQLNAELKELDTKIIRLKEKREALVKDFVPQILEVYNELKKQRGTPVAKVEQGICRGCRISLSVNELQQVRSGAMVRCSSCGRILFLV